MSIRHFSLQVLVVVVILSSAIPGCRALTFTGPAWLMPTAAKPTASKVVLSQELVDLLADRLNRDDWKPNREWSPLGGLPDRRKSSRGTSQARSTSASASSETSSHDGERHVHVIRRWNFGRESIVPLLDRIDSLPNETDSHGAANAYLMAVAKRGGLPGWNAMILLSQRAPVTAIDHLPVLEQLCSTALSYDPQTGAERKGKSDLEDSASGADAGKQDAGSKKLAEGGDTNNAENRTSAERLVRDLQREESETEQNSAAPRDDKFALLRDGKSKLRRPTLAPGGKSGNGKSGGEGAGSKGGTGSGGEAESTTQGGRRQVSLSMRAAAIEAWCLVLVQADRDPLAALAPAARLAERKDLPLLLEGELMRSLARWAAPVLIPHVESAFSGMTGDEVIRASDIRVPLERRRAAIESCLIHAVALHYNRETMPAAPAAAATTASSSTDKTSGTSKPSSDAAKDAKPADAKPDGAKPAEAKPAGDGDKSASPSPAAVGSKSADGKSTPTATPSRAYEPSRWPEPTILRCRYDRDSAVRRTFGAWLGVSRNPRAVELLESQLLDLDLSVREAAMESLSLRGNNAAKLLLINQTRRTEERIRGQAVRHLCRWDVRTVSKFARDKSDYVRNSLAEGLGMHPEVDAAILLRDLLADPSMQVQETAARGLESWPDSLALPLWLHGLQEAGPATRRLCWKLLSERQKLDENFPLDGSKSERRVAAEKFAARLDLPLGFLDRLRKEGLAAEPTRSPSSDQNIRQHLDTLCNHPPSSQEFRRAVDELKKAAPQDAPLVEAELNTAPAAAAEALRQDVLPKISPAWEGLRDLESKDPLVRQRGAKRVAHAAEQRTLRPEIVRRLRELLLAGQDRLVWRYALASVMPDATDDGAGLALLALNHFSPDIRILGCQYVERHARAEHAEWLLPLFQDPDRQVLLEAVRAAGRCGNRMVIAGRPSSGRSPGGAATKKSPGLRDLLTHADSAIRNAATASLARLGDEQGLEELMRLSLNPNPAIREEAVREMGANGQTRFVEHLIRLGWTESHETVRRTLLASLEQLVPEEQRPQGLASEPRYDMKIRLWATRELTKADATRAAASSSPMGEKGKPRQRPSPSGSRPRNDENLRPVRNDEEEGSPPHRNNANAELELGEDDLPRITPTRKPQRRRAEARPYREAPQTTPRLEYSTPLGE